MNWEKVSKEIRTQNWIILLIMGLPSFFFANPAFTMGIALGGLIIIANFNVLQYTIRSAFSVDSFTDAKKKFLIAKCYFRLAIVGIIIYILITDSWVDPVGLAIGLSTVVISIFSFGIRLALKTSSEEMI